MDTSASTITAAVAKDRHPPGSPTSLTAIEVLSPRPGEKGKKTSLFGKSSVYENQAIDTRRLTVDPCCTYLRLLLPVKAGKDGAKSMSASETDSGTRLLTAYTYIASQETESIRRRERARLTAAWLIFRFFLLISIGPVHLEPPTTSVLSFFSPRLLISFLQSIAGLFLHS